MARIVDEAKAGWRTEIAARPVWVHSPMRRAVELGSAVACAAAVLDAAVSWVVLHQSLAWERNPVAARSIETFGLGPTMVGGAVLRIAIVAVLAFLALRAVRRVVRLSAASVLLMATAWWTMVVFANAVVVGRTHLV